MIMAKKQTWKPVTKAELTRLRAAAYKAAGIPLPTPTKAEVKKAKEYLAAMKSEALLKRLAHNLAELLPTYPKLQDKVYEEVMRVHRVELRGATKECQAAIDEQYA